MSSGCVDTTSEVGWIAAQALATTWLTSLTPSSWGARAAGWEERQEGWAGRQGQPMVAQEPRPTVSRTRSTAFPGLDNHLPAHHPNKRPRRAGGTPITGAASLFPFLTAPGARICTAALLATT